MADIPTTARLPIRGELDQRQRHHGEFRLYAARMLAAANMPDAARLVLTMQWDEWATEDERTERERMPE